MPEEDSSFELLPVEEVAKLLPSYSEISFLAKGGMAAVYQGVQTTLDRPVAIKILPREFGADESFRLRFIAEGKAMARLNHPNLVGIFDFGEVDGLLYLVMEFVEGKTLYEHSYGKPMDELMALDLCRRVANGLAHAHNHKVLHRDIKPANVLLDPKFNPKLGDFGLAEGDEREEGDTLNFGTPGYTPPEVMVDPNSADEKSDIYAVGVMLYELLTTTVPQNPYQPPSQLVQSDPRIDAIITQAIQPDPALRPTSAQALAEQLQTLHDQIEKAPHKRLKTSTQVSARSLQVATPPLTQPTNSAAARAAEENRARPQQKTLASARLGGNLTLIRNVAIIAILLGAIFAFWNARENKTKKTTAGNESQVEKLDPQNRPQKAEQEASLIEREATKKGHSPSITTTSTTAQPEHTATPPKETLLEESESRISSKSLAELQPALANGKLTEFPIGSLRRDSSYYLYVAEPRNWYHAIEFAEDHGAQLVSIDEISWLAENTPAEAGTVDLWIAAGATGPGTWAWFDHELEFTLPIPPSSTKIAGIASHLGVLKARHPSEEHPFFLQWPADDQAVPTRASNFQRIAETINSEKPIWPPGIRSFKKRRYLTVGRTLTYEEAETIALTAGGKLAVPSDDLEAAFLRDYIEESGFSSLWIGGRKAGKNWQWSTREKWNKTNWSAGHPRPTGNDSALALQADGWVNLHPFEEMPGFIIEWSQDAISIPQEATRPPSNLNDVESLRQRAKIFLESQKSNNDFLSLVNGLRRAYLTKIDEVLIASRAGQVEAKIGPLTHKIEQVGSDGPSFLEYLGISIP